MRTWTRAIGDTLCGGPCGRLIAKGDPLLVIVPAGLVQPHRRCVHCAGESVPADLPPLVERSNVIEPRYQPRRAPLFASVGAIAQDWKMKQAGREPGEDD